MHLIFKGHPSYVEPTNITSELQKIYEYKCGKYTCRYNFYDICFGFYPKEQDKKLRYVNYNNNPLYVWAIPIKLEILDDNNTIIHTKNTSYTPNINLYGDGQTLENTFYTILENGDNNKRLFNCYDLTGKCIKSYEIWSKNMSIKIYKDYYIIYNDNELGVAKIENVTDKYIDINTCIPLIGQNKIFCVEIKDDIIIFNDGSHCTINDIKYERSKFLLQGNPLYSKLQEETDIKDIKHFVHTCGIFTAEYDYEDHCGLFDSNIGKFGKSTLVTFKENGNTIFELNSGCAPSIILHGDGKTRENTKFCIGGVSIYDFNQKLIRVTRIGSDTHHDIQRVNDFYAISNSIDVCCWANFFGIIDLELFFSQNGDEEYYRPYDNARIHVPLRGDDRIYVTCADEDGLILNNGKKIRYEDAESYDFSNGKGYHQIDFSKLGYNEEQVKQIESTILRGGVVSIPIS
jgi:hypothetical protein